MFFLFQNIATPSNNFYFCIIWNFAREVWTLFWENYGIRLSCFLFFCFFGIKTYDDYASLFSCCSLEWCLGSRSFLGPGEGAGGGGFCIVWQAPMQANHISHVAPKSTLSLRLGTVCYTSATSYTISVCVFACARIPSRLPTGHSLTEVSNLRPYKEAAAGLSDVQLFPDKHAHSTRPLSRHHPNIWLWFSQNSQHFHSAVRRRFYEFTEQRRRGAR